MLIAAEQLAMLRDGEGGVGGGAPRRKSWVDRIILTRDKTLVRGDILLDDAPLAKGSSLEPVWEHVYFDQPYNRPGASDADPSRRRLVAWKDWGARCRYRPTRGSASEGEAPRSQLALLFVFIDIHKAKQRVSARVAEHQSLEPSGI